MDDGGEGGQPHAVVVDVDGELAHLDGSSPRGLPVAVDLPRVLLERQSLKLGDVVWVFSRVAGDAALVELLPAVRVLLRDLRPDRLGRRDRAALQAFT